MEGIFKVKITIFTVKITKNAVKPAFLKKPDFRIWLPNLAMQVVLFTEAYSKTNVTKTKKCLPSATKRY